MLCNALPILQSEGQLSFRHEGWFAPLQPIPQSANGCMEASMINLRRALFALILGCWALVFGAAAAPVIPIAIVVDENNPKNLSYPIPPA